MAHATGRTAAASHIRLRQSFRGRVISLMGEGGIVILLFLAASVATITTVAIFFTLLYNGWTFFQNVSLVEFLTGTRWAPDFKPQGFGALPLVKGTLQIGLGAIVLALPIAIGTAVYLSEFANPRVRAVVKPALEVLAGIPSIVFGVVALFTISPLFQKWFGWGVFSAGNATVVIAVMIIPIITSLSEDAVRAVPKDLRDGALALGATPWEVTRGVVVPAAASGITAAVLLGFGRAIGETMAVTLAAGLVPTMALDYGEPSQTITAFIANRAQGDLAAGTIQYTSIFAVGLLLFLMTFVLNIVAHRILSAQRRRFQS